MSTYCITGGMTELGCDSVDKLKSKLQSLDMEILDQNKFKEIFMVPTP